MIAVVFFKIVDSIDISSSCRGQNGNQLDTPNAFDPKSVVSGSFQKLRQDEAVRHELVRWYYYAMYQYDSVAA